MQTAAQQSPTAPPQSPYAIDPLPERRGGWFRDECRAALAEEIVRLRPRVIVELGSWLGESAIWMAKRMPDRCHLYCVDTWKGGYEHQEPQYEDLLPTLYEQFLSNVIHAGLQDRITPIRATTREAFDRFRAVSVDLVYVDASHRYQDVLQDMRDYWRVIRSGGAMVGDDLDWPDVAHAVTAWERESGETVWKGAHHWRVRKA